MEYTNKDRLIKEIIEKHIMTYKLALLIALNCFEEKDLLQIEYECGKGQRFTPTEFEIFLDQGRQVQDCENVIR